MQHSAIHDPYAHATPSQRQATAAHNLRHKKIAAIAGRVTPKQTISFSIPNTPFGVPKIPPPVIVPVSTTPYAGMWFYGLVKESENYNPMIGTSRADRIPRIEEIQKACALHYGVTIALMVSSSRTRDIVIPRQVAMYLCRTLTPRSWPEIGRRFGNRDHTTGIHATNKISELLQTDQALASDVGAITAYLKERFAL
jgi:Bacterial dnaA protein helix-turn-helix